MLDIRACFIKQYGASLYTTIQVPLTTTHSHYHAQAASGSHCTYSIDSHWNLYSNRMSGQSDGEESNGNKDFLGLHRLVGLLQPS